MTTVQKALRDYASDVAPLLRSDTTTEPSYYPAIRSLLVAVLRSLGLPDDVRINTSERREGGRDVPDVALYDGGGDFVVVCGEVKGPTAFITEMAGSTDQEDQIGRYLAQTRAVLLSNVRGFGLLVADPDFDGPGLVPPEARLLEQTVDLWPSVESLARGESPLEGACERLAELVEIAVTAFAPIAEPETLARVLALEARRAKAALPTRFTRAVETLADDFGTALGIAFEGEEGEEFFRSSLIQTVFYSLFAGWILWAREDGADEFDWRDLGRYLKIPFLGELFHEIQHPRRIAELELAPRLDLAAGTLGRVDRDRFFDRIQLPTLGEGEDPEQAAATAIVYFYEPFLETFDPELRKELGVWYTPPEIVRYQVRKVDRLLREKLGCARGFADERVVVLDPGCGTGAYLIEILNSMAETLRAEGVEAELGDTLLRAVQGRVYGFEILTAPFVISHLQLHLILTSLGAEPSVEERPGVFLTNSLTGWSGETQIELHFPELQEEHDAAQRVKDDAPIIVIMGNPPYNRFAGAPIAEEQTLIDPYKGIRRDPNGRQIGTTELYRRWGIRKHLLDDLYIRFFRLAEERIGVRAAHGVVSYISNSSFLSGRSHPIMREHLLRSFHALWIDNLNGDKYKTGKIIPRDEPGAGTSDQSIFSTPQNPGGIQVGTAITTLLKHREERSEPSGTPIRIRDFWGRAEDKRRALLESLEVEDWSAEAVEQAAERPEGPRHYAEFLAREDRRWKLVPYEAVGGYDDWLALDELFSVSFQGVNPNRGIHGSVIDTHRQALETRMREYFSEMSFEELRKGHPELCRDRARYDAEKTRSALCENSEYSAERVCPYVIFPIDGRFLYYETEQKLLNEARAELWKNLAGNEFLIAVPQARRASETLPLFTSTAFDLHLHDRGSVGFPATVKENRDEPIFFGFGSEDEVGEPHANLNRGFWAAIQESWELGGGLAGETAQNFVRRAFRVCLAIGHSPEYQDDHRETLSHDWAHVPFPRDRELFEQIAEAGDRVARLLDPFADVREVIDQVIGGERAAGLAVLTPKEGGAVREADLVVDISYYGAATGRWDERPPDEGEPTHPTWGETTGDLYLNDQILLKNVPERVWRYELGGYPVVKKWLGYRHERYRGGAPLTLQEKDALRGIVHRIAALLTLHPSLDELYRQAAVDPWTADDIAADSDTDSLSAGERE